ncbi:hypothetical protein ABZ357_40240 [Streptomyces sp. NPDC005917]|uniref:hypothetical protein n=1 Tax=unclassified Streptomyces TaxID=2593676 RepID=UPI0033F8198A
MALSRLARDFAAEISNHDWSDAPYRIDRAGHSRTGDSKSKLTEQVLTEDETRRVKTNVMWVTAQVLASSDPNFDVYEFAEACGINILTSSGRRDGGIAAGLRQDAYGRYMRPGMWEVGSFDEVITTETSEYYHDSPDCEWFRRGWQGTPLLTYSAQAVPAKWKQCGKCIGGTE